MNLNQEGKPEVQCWKCKSTDLSLAESDTLSLTRELSQGVRDQVNKLWELRQTVQGKGHDKGNGLRAQGMARPVYLKDTQLDWV